MLALENNEKMHILEVRVCLLCLGHQWHLVNEYKRSCAHTTAQVELMLVFSKMPFAARPTEKKRELPCSLWHSALLFV